MSRRLEDDYPLSVVIVVLRMYATVKLARPAHSAERPRLNLDAQDGRGPWMLIVQTP
jgi:hypothetical protein